MRRRRESGSDPFTLILGAGASVQSGAQLARPILEQVVGSYDWDKWNAYLSRCNDEDRFAHLRALIEGSSPSPGYRALADLVRASYFDVILSTNFDPLLEDALNTAGLRRRDTMLLVHPIMDPRFIAQQLSTREPRVKVVKLHGDLFYRKFLFTAAEITAYPEHLKRGLYEPLNHRDVLVVGHALSDANLNACFDDVDRSVWKVDPGKPSAAAAELLKRRKSLELCIAGEAGTFDAFFMTLRELLLGEEGTAPGVDELRESVFALHAPGQQKAIGTGFLVRDHGVIVTDAFAAAGVDPQHTVGSLADMHPMSGGAPVRVRLEHPPEHLLDYVVYRPVDGNAWLAAQGLIPSDAEPRMGERVTVHIAAGSNSGFAETRVMACRMSIKVAGATGIINASDLIQLDLGVQGGACGSPIVGAGATCYGMIVAGRADGLPPAFALPSSHLLKKLNAPKRPSKADKRRARAGG